MRNNNSTRIATLAIMCLLGAMPVVGAAVPTAINYQGYLADSGGQPLSGTHNITFAIYAQPASGSPLWSQARAIPVTNGNFQVLLGEVNPLPAAIFADSVRYLGVKIGSDPQLSPRTRLVSAPYALQADNAARLNGVDAGEYARLSTSNLFDGTTNNFSSEVWISDHVLTLRRDFRDRWELLNPSNGGLQFRQVYNDADVLLNQIRLEIGDNGYVGVGTTTPWARVHAISSDTITGLFTSSNSSNDTRVLSAEVTGPSAVANPVAVWGRSVMDTATGGGYGGMFVGGTAGLTALGYEFGLYGIGSDKSAGGHLTYGTVGLAFGSAGGGGTNYGVYGQALGGGTNWGGYFLGNVNVTGNISKGGGAFRIDHPLDPENKILMHSFVESPDMLNIYSGIAQLNEEGAATVTLPGYFEALNRDFRYQLTAIGSSAPGLYVASKIEGNRFRIAGGNPGMEVSWQVTGVRDDAYARANRIPVELEKTADERGRYLHPRAFELPAERGVDHAKAPPGDHILD